jgi:hypothetical protein
MLSDDREFVVGNQEVSGQAYDRPEPEFCAHLCYGSVYVGYLGY